MKFLVFAAIFSVVNAATHAVETRENPETIFKTEPSFVLEFIHIHSLTPNSSLLAPGYLFIAPTAKDDAYGPQIYQLDGTLVWYDSIEDGHRVQDFHACDYQGEEGTHLCWSEMLSSKLANNLNPANKIIASHDYTVVARFDTSTQDAQPNLHEFNSVDHGNSYVQPVFPTLKTDLSQYGGDANGYMWDSCFQDISTHTANPIFEWCWLDYYHESETSIWFMGNKVNITSPKAGTGALNDPFDPGHINAIDKNFEGDYIVSLRHVDQILKIAGVNNRHGVSPGTTLWRLGGASNQFRLEGDAEALHFSKQHHVRFISTTATETVFSILDNAWEGCTDSSSKSSSGKIIAINNSTMTARLLHHYPHPNDKLTPSQASMQLLPNGNAFIGWGALPEISEYTSDGSLIYHASWSHSTSSAPAPHSLTAGDHSYRSFKQPWIGNPSWAPKLLAYSRTCNTGPSSPLVAYASWNGATQVAAWRFSISSTSKGPWYVIGAFEKTGFETQVVLLDREFPAWLRRLRLSHAPFVSVAALDEDGHEIAGGAAVAETFVPRRNVGPCDAFGCGRPEDRFVYSPDLSRGRKCARSMAPQMMALLLLVVLLELVEYSYLSVMAAWAVLFVAGGGSKSVLQRDTVRRDSAFDDAENGGGGGEGKTLWNQEMGSEFLDAPRRGVPKVTLTGVAKSGHRSRLSYSRSAS